MTFIKKYILDILLFTCYLYITEINAITNRLYYWNEGLTIEVPPSTILDNIWFLILAISYPLFIASIIKARKFVTAPILYFYIVFFLHSCIYFIFEAAGMNFGFSLKASFPFLALILAFIFVIIALPMWNWKNSESDKYDPDKYQVICLPPSKPLHALVSILKMTPYGQYRICYKGNQLKFSFMKNTLIETPFDPNAQKCKFINLRGNKKHMDELWKGLLHMKYSLIFNNCMGLKKKFEDVE